MFEGVLELNGYRYQQDEEMPLTDTFARQTKQSGAAAGDKHSDGGGMYLLVNVTGKYWRLNYRVNGKQKTLALGISPEASLATARKLHERARRQLVTGLISWCCSKKAEASLVRAQLDTS